MSEEIKSDELVEYQGRRIYPEVATYLSGIITRKHARLLARLEADHAQAIEYHKVTAECELAGHDSIYAHDAAEYLRRVDAAREVRSAAYNAADQQYGPEGDLQPLLESSHKEVAFIAKYCITNQGDEIQGHARTILSHLPATTEEIWRVAKEDADMCGVFDRFYEQAEAEGVFDADKADDPFPALRELTAMRNWVRREYGNSPANRLIAKMEPALRKLHENYETRLAQAKAEWQHLDEAYAENTHRNRSAAARRAAETRRRNAEILADADPEPTTDQLKVIEHSPITA